MGESPQIAGLLMKKSINEVTFKLMQDEDGRFVMDIRQSRDGGITRTAGFYSSCDTIYEAIQRGLAEVAKFLTPEKQVGEETKEERIAWITNACFSMSHDFDFMILCESCKAKIKAIEEEL